MQGMGWEEQEGGYEIIKGLSLFLRFRSPRSSKLIMVAI